MFIAWQLLSLIDLMPQVCQPGKEDVKGRNSSTTATIGSSVSVPVHTLTFVTLWSTGSVDLDVEPPGSILASVGLAAK